MKQDKKVISLRALYDTIQSKMDEAGIGDESSRVNVDMRCYEHWKTGKYSAPTKEPETVITIHIGGSLVAHDVKSVEEAMMKVDHWFEERKMQKEPKESIDDVTVQI